MVIKIPRQLQNENFRFIRLKKNTKDGFLDESWSKNMLKYNDPILLKHLEEDGNYGVVGGPGNLRINDIDKEEVCKEMSKKFDTWVVLTCGKFYHCYYISPYSTNHKTLVGEFRANNEYVVGPGCYAIDKKKKHEGFYIAANDLEIKEVSAEEMSAILDNPLQKREKIEYESIIFEKVDKEFIESTIFPTLKPEIKEMINTEYVTGKRSEYDQKVITHLVLKGYTKYIKSIFELYPIGSKYREHRGKEKYLAHNINTALGYSGAENDLVPALKQKIFNVPKNVLINKMDEFLNEINKSIEKPINREDLFIDISKKSGYSMKIIRDRSKELESENTELNLDADMISASDLLKLPCQRHKWHINPILLDGAATMLVGDPSTFKSGFAILLSLSLLSSSSMLLDRFPIEDKNKPKILYYGIEMGKTDILRTLIDYFKNGLNLTAEEIENFKVRPNFTTPEKELAFAIKQKAKIIIIDSLVRLIGDKDENTSRVANDFFMKYIKPLKEIGISVIVIHHAKKPDKDNNKISIHNVRGSSDIPAQYDTVWQLEKLGDEEDTLSEDYIPSSETAIIKDYDVVVTRSKDSRVLTNIKTFTFHVHVDEKTQTTTFKFLYYHKAKNRENNKNTVFDYIKTHGLASRVEMINYFKDDFKVSTLDNYLDALKAENKITSTGSGKGGGIYTLLSGIPVIKDPQRTLDKIPIADETRDPTTKARYKADIGKETDNLIAGRPRDEGLEENK